MCSCLPHYLLFEPVPPTQQGRPLSVCSTGGKLDYQWMLACIMKNIELAQKIARENNARAQQKMKECYDRTVREPDFLEGSTVWVFVLKGKKGLSKKLLHNYHGPYLVVEKLSPVHYRLRTCNNKPVSAIVHANCTKTFIDPND